MDMYINGPIGAGKRGPGVIAECVLIAGKFSDPRIGALNGLLIKLRKSFATGIDGVFSQNIAVAKAGKANSIQLVIDRDGSRVDPQGINGDVVGEQNLTYLVVM